MIFSVAACGDHPLFAPSAKVLLHLSADSLTVAAIDGVQKLDVAAHDAAGDDVTPKVLLWKSSDPSTVSVDNKGNVTALKDGDATVTVSVGTLTTASALVHVRATIWAAASVASMRNESVDSSATRDSVGIVVHAAAAK